MSHYATTGPYPYGMVAEFDSPKAVTIAARKTTEHGYSKVEAYTPFPVHGLDDAIGFRQSKVQWTIFLCGVAGCLIGLSMQYWWANIDYPMNVGGRPLWSWPSNIPVTFECTILASAFGAVFGMLAYNGLPKPYHPIFEVTNFERASQDRFFLLIEAHDPQYDREATRQFMETLGALNVEELEADEDGHHEVA